MKEDFVLFNATHSLKFHEGDDLDKPKHLEVHDCFIKLWVYDNLE